MFKPRFITSLFLGAGLVIASCNSNEQDAPTSYSTGTYYVEPLYWGLPGSYKTYYQYFYDNEQPYCYSDIPLGNQFFANKPIYIRWAHLIEDTCEIYTLNSENSTSDQTLDSKQ